MVELIWYHFYCVPLQIDIKATTREAAPVAYQYSFISFLKYTEVSRPLIFQISDSYDSTSNKNNI